MRLGGWLEVGSRLDATGIEHPDAVTQIECRRWVRVSTDPLDLECVVTGIDSRQAETAVPV